MSNTIESDDYEPMPEKFGLSTNEAKKGITVTRNGKTYTLDELNE